MNENQLVQWSPLIEADGDRGFPWWFFLSLLLLFSLSLSLFLSICGSLEGATDNNNKLQPMTNFVYCRWHFAEFSIISIFNFQSWVLRLECWLSCANWSVSGSTSCLQLAPIDAQQRKPIKWHLQTALQVASYTLQLTLLQLLGKSKWNFVYQIIRISYQRLFKLLFIIIKYARRRQL